MIDKAKDILGFNFNPSFFEGVAKRAFNDDVVARNIKRVNEVSDAIVSSIGAVSNSDIERIVSSLQNEYKKSTSPQSVFLPKRDIRALSYNILASWDLGFLKFCLKVMNENWSTTMTRGLMHSVMSQWDEFEPDAKSALLNTLTTHIDSDNSKCAALLRPQKAFLIDPYKIGRKLLAEKKPIIDCCIMFGLPTNRFNYSFFTPAIIAYYEQYNTVSLDELKKVLRDHNNIKADKTILPRLIIQISNSNRSSILPKEWVNFAVERIGDPSVESKWAPFPMATREVQANLEKARTIVMIAISSEFVNVFFNKLCYDQDRLHFWLKHTGKIRDFKVYGTSVSQSYIQPYVNGAILSRHFNTVSTNTTNCALVMYLGNYTMIEFTEVGALYVYQVKSDAYKRVFGSGRINKLEDLKQPYMQNLIGIDSYYNYNYDEGRMIHTGYWQSRLNNWISRKI